MAIIHIDGQTSEVDGADNLLQACLSLASISPILFITLHWARWVLAANVPSNNIITKKIMKRVVVVWSCRVWSIRPQTCGSQ